MRILILEDDKILGGMIAESLRKNGFAVDWAETAGAAMQCLTVERFDLLILDLGLPDSDGHSVVRKLRQLGQSLPVLILTARDALDERVKGLDQGADDYVIKPIAMPELHARVRALSLQIQDHAFSESRMRHPPAQTQTFTGILIGAQ